MGANDRSPTGKDLEEQTRGGMKLASGELHVIETRKPKGACRVQGSLATAAYPEDLYVYNGSG